MTRGRARRYLLTKSDESYYPQVVADAGYDVWDWSTLNAGTLFQDSAKTTPASANGDVVGCWTDGVGGVDATQATTANKPGLATGSLNGLPTLSFDGGDLLATANISISTFAVWCVFRASNANFVYEHVLSTNRSYLRTTTGATVLTQRTVNASGNLTIDWGADNTWRVSRHGYNGTVSTQTLALNDILQSLSTSGTDPGTGLASAPLGIGARVDGTGGITGDIAQLCVVSPYPTQEIIANMESYINSKWSVY